LIIFIVKYIDTSIIIPHLSAKYEKSRSDVTENKMFDESKCDNSSNIKNTCGCKRQEFQKELEEKQTTSIVSM